MAAVETPEQLRNRATRLEAEASRIDCGLYYPGPGDDTAPELRTRARRLRDAAAKAERTIRR